MEREPFEFPHADIIDTRDLHDLLAEMVNADDLDDGEVLLLVALQAMEGDIADWQYGEALIADSYFEAYARELADDIGAVARDASWPNQFIDWDRATRALQMDYTSYDIDGVTYWARA